MEIERLELALKEEERLAPIEAAQHEEAAKQQSAGEKLTPRIAACNKTIDAGFAMAAKGIAQKRTLSRHQDELLGRQSQGGWNRDSTTEGSLRFHLTKHGVGDVVERAHSAVGHPPARPLAEES